MPRTGGRPIWTPRTASRPWVRFWRPSPRLPELANPAEPLPASPGGADTRRQDLAEIEAWLNKHRKVPGALLQRLGGDWGNPEITSLRNALLEQISQFEYARALDTLTLLWEKLPS